MRWAISFCGMTATGRFEEVGLFTGLAYDLHGIGQGTMGVECGDYNNDGRLDFYMTSYQKQWATLYRNLGNGMFQDVTHVDPAPAPAPSHRSPGEPALSTSTTTATAISSSPAVTSRTRWTSGTTPPAITRETSSWRTAAREVRRRLRQLRRRAGAKTQQPRRRLRRSRQRWQNRCGRSQFTP
jgi:hypothetical protein